jgi:hypothetical protein
LILRVKAPIISSHVRSSIWGTRHPASKPIAIRPAELTAITSALDVFRNLSARSWADDDYDVVRSATGTSLAQKEARIDPGLLGCG